MDTSVSLDHFSSREFASASSPWNNTSTWLDKVILVKKHLVDVTYKRLILTHHKDLNKGHYLIDERINNSASELENELILFGSEKFSKQGTYYTISYST